MPPDKVIVILESHCTKQNVIGVLAFESTPLCLSLVKMDDKVRPA